MRSVATSTARSHPHEDRWRPWPPICGARHGGSTPSRSMAICAGRLRFGAPPPDALIPECHDDVSRDPTFTARCRFTICRLPAGRSPSRPVLKSAANWPAASTFRRSIRCGATGLVRPEAGGRRVKLERASRGRSGADLRRHPRAGAGAHRCVFRAVLRLRRPGGGAEGARSEVFLDSADDLPVEPLNGDLLDVGDAGGGAVGAGTGSLSAPPRRRLYRLRHRRQDQDEAEPPGGRLALAGEVAGASRGVGLGLPATANLYK